MPSWIQVDPETGYADGCSLVWSVGPMGRFSLFLTSKPIARGRLCCRTQISEVKDGASHHLCPISCTVNLGDPSPIGLLDCDAGVTLIYVLVCPCHPQPLAPREVRNDRVLHLRRVPEQSRSLELGLGGPQWHQGHFRGSLGTSAHAMLGGASCRGQHTVN